jgi:hypothetical protein
MAVGHAVQTHDPQPDSQPSQNSHSVGAGGRRAASCIRQLSEMITEDYSVRQRASGGWPRKFLSGVLS